MIKIIIIAILAFIIILMLRAGHEEPREIETIMNQRHGRA